MENSPTIGEQSVLPDGYEAWTARASAVFEQELQANTLQAPSGLIASGAFRTFAV